MAFAFDWIKPNKYKLIITFILILLNFILVVYSFSYGICNVNPLVPQCPSNPLGHSITPLVDYTYYPFYIQNELADSILYKITYINGGAHTTEEKYPTIVNFIVRAIFILLALSIHLIFYYIIGCLIYILYAKIKNK